MFKGQKITTDLPDADLKKLIKALEDDSGQVSIKSSPTSSTESMMIVMRKEPELRNHATLIMEIGRRF